MDMRIGQAGNDRPSLQIDDLGAVAGELAHLVAGTDREDAAHLDRHRLRLAVAGIDRQDTAVGEDQIRAKGGMHTLLLLSANASNRLRGRQADSCCAAASLSRIACAAYGELRKKAGGNDNAACRKRRAESR